MFHWLVGRTIFTEIEAIVGEFVNDADFLNRPKPECRPGIVGKTQECRVEWNQPAMKSDAVSDSRHRKFSDTECQVSALRGFFLEITDCFRKRSGHIGRLEIGAATDEFWNLSRPLF